MKKEDIKEIEISEDESTGSSSGVTPQNATGTGKKWETGLKRGKANPISNHGDWESGVEHGKANPVTTNEALNSELTKMKERMGLNEAKEDGFTEFATKRLAGATKIAESAKEKGGPSMLTYHHFNVKLPYYKKASEGKFEVSKAKTELAEHLDKLCSMTKDVDMEQIQFQKLVGIIEVLGELIIKSK